jgi:hypothetical protein
MNARSLRRRSWTGGVHDQVICALLLGGGGSAKPLLAGRSAPAGSAFPLPRAWPMNEHA